MIKYEKSMPFSGNAAAAMGMTKNIFADNGFELTHVGEEALSVKGPGMTSTKQHPIRGLSRGELSFTNSTLEFRGELGGVEFMRRFLFIFPVALGGGLAVFFYWKFQDLQSLYTSVLAVAPWLFLSPYMAKRIQKKTEKALDTVLKNISQDCFESGPSVRDGLGRKTYGRNI